MKINLSKWMAAALLAAIVRSTSSAQTLDLDGSAGCLVSAVTGKVTYTEKGASTASPVAVGAIIPDDASVNIGKKSALTLVSGDRSLAVTQKGAHLMSALAKEVTEKGERSRFAQMASVAKGYGDVPPSPIGGGKKGWGGRDSIIFQSPVGGKMLLQTTTIQWSALKEGSVYRLTVYQGTKEAPVLEALTSATAFTFDPAQLAVKTDQPCFAQVVLASDGTVKSKQAKVTFVPIERAENTLAALKKDQEYLNAGAQQRALMEATELEGQEFWSGANERYRAALQLDGSNSLAKRMYTAFLDRASK